jgi:hypothetical protein
MTEMTIDWNMINATDEIDEAAQAASEDISMQTPVGRFLCTVMDPVEAIEKEFQAYACYAAKLKMRIDSVLKIEQPILDEKGVQIKRNGEPITKVLDVPASQIDAVRAKYSGRFIFDEIPLANPKEKEAMKNRRLFVAKRLGLISPTSTQLDARAWPGAAGKQVIVETEWNSWKDKNTGETKRNVRVAWSGYDYAGGALSNQVNGDASFDPETFDI